MAVRLEDVHPDNLALAVRAAALLQLDIAGVDLLISDIEQSWFQVGALICEVNAKPQVGVRTSPGIYLEMLRRTMGEKTRIPAHLLVVDNDRRLDETWVADQMRELSCNSLATADGVWIDGMKLVGIPRSAFESARILFGEHDADAALCIMPVSEIAGNGLPLHWFDSIRLLGDFAAHERIVGALTPHTSSLVEVTANA